ncbi:MAG TPA: Ig-like domain-containing protein [Longimicrobium sp.]|nr:Ig-like domain-containing protein [Longimicrobium sp.]
MNVISPSSRRNGLRRAVVCGATVCAGLLAGCTERAKTPLGAPDDALLALTPNNMIIVAGNNQYGLPDDTLAKPITVEVRYGSTRVPNVTVNWSVTSGGGGLRHAASVTNSNGRASNYWKPGTSGTQTVRAEVPGAGFVEFNASLLPPGSTLQLISGDDQTGLMNTNYLLHPLVVELVDGNGDPVPGIPVTWIMSSANGALRYKPTTTTGGDGRTQNDWGLGNTTEPKTLRAEVGQLAVVFSATGIKRVLFSIVSGNNQVGNSTDSLPAPLVVEVRDTMGAPLPDIRVRWYHGTATGGLRTFISGTDSQGRASNRWILAAAPDTQLVLATLGGGAAQGTQDLRFKGVVSTMPSNATITFIQLSRTRVYSRHVDTERDLTATVQARAGKGITHASFRFLNPSGVELPGGACSVDLSATLPTIVAQPCTVRIPFGAAHGWYTVEATVEDAAGNTDTETKTFRVDATNPLTSSAAGISPTTVNSSASDPAARQVTGSMTAASSQGVTQLTVTLLTAGSPQCSKALSGATSVTDSCALTVPQGLAAGTYTVQVRMTDAAGNVVGANRALAVTN